MFGRLKHNVLACPGVLALVVWVGACTSTSKPADDRQPVSNSVVKSQAPPDDAVTIVGSWSHTGSARWPSLASVVDSDGDGCPEVLTSAKGMGWHLLHGSCEAGARWESREIVDRNAWAGLVGLHDGVHALIEWRREAGETTLSLSCGMADHRVWRTDASSSMVVGHSRPVLVSAVPAESGTGPPSFLLFDREHMVTQLQVDAGCELSRVRQFSSPPIQLLAADWWTSATDGSVSLCVTSARGRAMVDCSLWSLEHQPNLRPLLAHAFIAPDLVLVAAPDMKYALTRFQSNAGTSDPSLIDAGLGQFGGQPTYTVGIVDGDTVIVAAGEPSVALIGLARFRPNHRPELRYFEHPVDGELVGIVPTRVTGAPGFVVLFVDERQVWVYVLRVNSDGIWQQ